MGKISKITSTADEKETSQRVQGRRDLILSELRNRIITGKLAPGKQLPRRFELMQHFGAASQTVQDALSRLQDDGFINAHPRRGTFVSERPPHLYQYGFCLPSGGHNPIKSLFYYSLNSAALGLEANSNINGVFYNALDEPEDKSEVNRLRNDVENQCLAGITFFAPPYVLAENGLLPKIHLPMAMVAQNPRDFNIPAVYPDIDKAIELAMNRLNELGCRRIAVLLALDPYGGGPDGPKWLNKFAVPPYFVHRLGPFDSYAIRHVLNLMMRSAPSDRPDGLLVVDDNMDDAVCVGLSESGIRVPDDIKVVALCNYPMQSTPALPLLRLCFDSRLIVKRCMENIEMQRNGVTPPALSLIAPQFEDEIPASFEPIHI